MTALNEFGERWQQAVGSTGPADRARAEAAMRQLYRDGGWPEPEIVWVGSPHALLVEQARRAEDGWKMIWQALGSAIGDQAWRALWDHLEASLVERLWEELRGVAVERNLPSAHRAETGRRIVEPDIPSDAVVVWRCRYADEWPTGCPSQWIEWSEWVRDVLPLFAFSHERLGVEGTEGVEPLVALAESAGPWLAYAGVAVIAERPLRVATDGQGRLHCSDGAAVEWPDGDKLYALNGIRVPARVVMKPEKLTVAEIVGERNLEVRRLMLEALGVERFFERAKMQQVRTDEAGTLWRADLPDDEALVLVEVENATVERDGTRKRYLLRVPPIFGSGQDPPRDAIAWTFGLSGNAYRLAAES
jgi:hypothetical protein